MAIRLHQVDGIGVYASIFSDILLANKKSHP